MKYIFLSSLFPKELTSEIEEFSKGNVQYAANTLQWHFTNGLANVLKEDLRIITAPLVGSYPLFYKKIFVKKSKFTVNKNVYGVSIGYFNLAILKNRIITRNLKSELSNQIRSYNNEPVVIIVYAVYGAYMGAAVYAKTHFNNITLCLIAPDLPEFGANNIGPIWRLRSLIQPDINKILPFFDKFVLLTDAMAEYLNIQEDQWIRIEGMVDAQDDQGSMWPTSLNQKKVVLYTGTLSARYGIINLLEAFEGITDLDYELWICGAGNTENVIKEKSLKDNRIRYLGLLPRKKILKIQLEATVLVNPRTCDGEYVKYSFPSKTMEYMLSGIPVIMNKLPGVPNEYDQFLFYPQDNSVKALQEKILEVCNLDNITRFEVGKRAKQFILDKKNIFVQVEKFINLIHKNLPSK